MSSTTPAAGSHLSVTCQRLPYLVSVSCSSFTLLEGCCCCQQVCYYQNGHLGSWNTNFYHGDVVYRVVLLEKEEKNSAEYSGMAACLQQYYACVCVRLCQKLTSLLYSPHIELSGCYLFPHCWLTLIIVILLLF